MSERRLIILYALITEAFMKIGSNAPGPGPLRLAACRAEVVAMLGREPTVIEVEDANNTLAHLDDDLDLDLDDLDDDDDDDDLDDEDYLVSFLDDDTLADRMTRAAWESIDADPSTAPPPPKLNWTHDAPPLSKEEADEEEYLRRQERDWDVDDWAEPL